MIWIIVFPIVPCTTFLKDTKLMREYDSITFTISGDTADTYRK